MARQDKPKHWTADGIREQTAEDAKPKHLGLVSNSCPCPKCKMTGCVKVDTTRTYVEEWLIRRYRYCKHCGYMWVTTEKIR